MFLAAPTSCLGAFPQVAASGAQQQSIDRPKTYTALAIKRDHVTGAVYTYTTREY